MDIKSSKFLNQVRICFLQPYGRSLEYVAPSVDF